jgi:hypothetical protein
MVYLGDDLTDTHAFESLHVLRQAGGVRTLAIGVVGPETPARVRQLADASVPTVAAAAELLGRVADRLTSENRVLGWI